MTGDTKPLRGVIAASLSGNYRNPKAIFLPQGTCLVSKPLKAHITFTDRKMASASPRGARGRG